MQGEGSVGGFLRAAACLLLLPPGLILCSTGAIVRAVLGGSPHEVNRWYTRFARLCVAVAGTDYEVHGRGNIKPGGYVVVCNHESNWDPVVLMAGLPEMAIRFVAKEQIMRIPIFGNALALTGNVRVDRSRSGKDINSVKRLMSSRQPDVCILFFAEGTRARDGAFREFKKGAFATALQKKLPILPVAVAGTFGIWTPESIVVRKGEAVVEIGEPIGVDGLDYQDRDALRQQTWEAVGRLRARARQRLRDRGTEPLGID